MKYVQKVFQHKLISGIFMADVLLLGGGWIWVSVALSHVKPYIIVHFNDIVGINQIGTLDDIHWFGLVAFLAVAIDYVLALELEERYRFLGNAMALFSLLFAGLIFIGFAVIISVNR